LWAFVWSLNQLRFGFIPLPGTGGMCMWAFIVPWLHAAGGSIWVVEILASADPPGTANNALPRARATIVRRMIVLL
jgi:hypothetical protein